MQGDQPPLGSIRLPPGLVTAPRSRPLTPSASMPSMANAGASRPETPEVLYNYRLTAARGGERHKLGAMKPAKAWTNGKEATSSTRLPDLDPAPVGPSASNGGGRRKPAERALDQTVVRASSSLPRTDRLD